MRDDRNFRAALLKVEDRVCRFSLRKKGLPGLQSNNSSPQPSTHQKGRSIKSGPIVLVHVTTLLPDSMMAQRAASPAGVPKPSGSIEELQRRTRIHRQESWFPLTENRPRAGAFPHTPLDFTLSSGSPVLRLLSGVAGNLFNFAQSHHKLQALKQPAVSKELNSRQSPIANESIVNYSLSRIAQINSGERPNVRDTLCASHGLRARDVAHG
jgi:hypothetical protein